MATYKGIQGYSVQKLSDDPTASSDTEGQLFYNSAQGKFKINVAGAGAWAAGNDLNTGKQEMGSAHDGTQNAALVFGGDNPTPLYLQETESYDGTSWTEVNNLNSSHDVPGGLGTQTAAMCVSGLSSTPTQQEVESWDGTSWTEVNNVLTFRFGGNATGTTTAALIAGGTTQTPGGNTRLDLTEIWNGTSWTETADLQGPATYGGSVGTSTSALQFAGQIAGGSLTSDKTESWNGTSWTEVNDLNTARYGVAGFGIVTAAICAGGTLNPGDSALTEIYDGTSWTELADLATARQNMGEAGTTASGLVAGGSPSSKSTEEWNDPSYTIKTVTVS